jgi:hypothetical protein
MTQARRKVGSAAILGLLLSLVLTVASAGREPQKDGEFTATGPGSGAKCAQLYIQCNTVCFQVAEPDATCVATLGAPFRCWARGHTANSTLSLRTCVYSTNYQESCAWSGWQVTNTCDTYTLYDGGCSSVSGVCAPVPCQGAPYDGTGPGNSYVVCP